MTNRIKTSNFRVAANRIYRPPCLIHLEARIAPARIVVNTSSDAIAVDSKVSIREAIDSINQGKNINADVKAYGSYGTSDSITFFGITVPINLTAANGLQLEITKAMTIAGLVGTSLTIANTAAAGPLSRVFSIAPSAGNVTISNITINGGNVTGGDGGGIRHVSGLLTLNNVILTANSTVGRGGGIYSSSGISMTNCQLIGNQASGSFGDGGGAFVDSAGPGNFVTCKFESNSAAVSGGALLVNSKHQNNVKTSTFINNTADSGGGISLSGYLTITKSTISSNKSSLLGGGLFCAAGELTLDACVISGNSAVLGGGLAATATVKATATTIDSNVAIADGGGIHTTMKLDLNWNSGNKQGNTISNNSAALGGGISVAGGSANIVSATIFGNSATGVEGGGGIHVDSGSLAIYNSTVAKNQSSGSGSVGGGIRWTSGLISLSSTIIADNVAAAGNSDLHWSGVGIPTIALNNSLISTTANNNITFSGVGVTNVPAELDSLGLQQNGAAVGAPKTVALVDGSPGINSGENSLSLTTDQRGSGFPRVSGSSADIGAFEWPDPSPIAKSVGSPSLVEGSTAHTLLVTYHIPVGSALINRASLGTGDISVNGPNGFAVVPEFVSANSAVDAKTITATYTFPAPDNEVTGQWDGSDNGTYKISQFGNQVFDNAATGALSVPAGTIGNLTVGLPVTYTVDEPTDIDDGDFSLGKRSFREALSKASTDKLISTINFLPSAFPAGTTIVVGSSMYHMDNRALTINGPGAANLTFDGAGSTRLFNFEYSSTIAISGVKLTNGHADSGGAIRTYYYNLLTLSKVELTGNSSTYSGGAIEVAGPQSLTLNDSTISMNQTGNGGGGAIRSYHGGTVTINRCTIFGNSSTNYGGFITAVSGHIIVVDSVLHGNSATNQGGAISFVPISGTSEGKITVSNCTLTGNVSRYGSAVWVSTNSTVTLNSSTLTDNTAGLTGGAVSAGKILVINSSIIAQNTGGNSPDISPNVAISGSDNIVGIGDGLIFSAASINIQKGTLAAPLSAKLSALGDYGGPTQSIGLMQGSPAINWGNNSASLTFDQRGPGYPRTEGALADVGAFEGFTPVPVGRLSPLTPIVSAGTSPNSVQVTYSDNSFVEPASLGVTDISITSPLGSQVPISSVTTLTPSDGSWRIVTYYFDAPFNAQSGWDASDNGDYVVTLNSNEVMDSEGNFAPTIVLGALRCEVPVEYIVDEVSDILDGLTGPGQMSIREAIDASNWDGVQSRILFSPIVFATPQVVVLNNGQLLITEPVTITGPVAGVTLDGNSACRILSVSLPSAADIALISQVTISNGNAENGGGISLLSGSLILSKVIVSNNVAGGDGGGIDVVNTYASLTLLDCDVIDNVAGGSESQGGGIHVTLFSAATMTLSNTTLSGNTAGEDGGAIYFYAGGTLNMDNCTVSANSSGSTGDAPDGGGGLFLWNTRTTIQNSTISDNKAIGSGGGIIAMGLQGYFLTVLRNSTVAFNTASQTGGGISKGAVLTSTILSNNVALGVGQDSDGKLSATFSLIGDSAGATVTGSSNLLNVDPNLVPLAANGGRTRTHAITSSSAAFNTGSNVALSSFDQRGSAYFRFAGAATDIGAFESQTPASKVVSIQVNNGSAQRSMVTNLKVTFDQVVHLPNTTADAFQLRRQSDGANVGLSAIVSGNAVTLTFTGGAVDGISLADGRYDLAVFAAKVSFGNFDGNSNGTAGDDFALIGTPNTGLFRLFGDANGDGNTGIADFGQLRLALGGSSLVFDFDNDGYVGASDFLQFRLRFGGSI